MFSASVVFACFRVLPSRASRRPTGLPPPRPSFGSPGPSGLQPLAAPTVPFQNSRASPLLHFDATLASCSHACHNPGCLMSTMIRLRIVPRVSFPALQHIRNEEPFFSLPGSLEAAWNRCPDSKKSHPRVWLPSRGDGLAPQSLEVSFNPQRS
jgi:hypothetical protein